jgi:predicted transcriptional regulator
MELQIPPELQAKLDRLEEQQGRDAQSLVREALERLVDYDSWFIEEVKKGLAQIERGKTLEHEEVGSRLEKLFAQKRQRM